MAIDLLDINSNGMPDRYSILLICSEDLDVIVDSKMLNTKYLKKSDSYGYPTSIQVKRSRVVCWGQFEIHYTVQEWLKKIKEKL